MENPSSTPSERTAAALRAIGQAIGPRPRAANGDAKPALLKPSLAIEALLAGLRVLFELDAAQIAELLAPALAPWRNAVGCTDRVLVVEEAAREPRLLPLPAPSWCAHAIDAGLLQLEGPPRLEGELVVQRGHLLGLRGAALGDPERFPIDFAAARAEASPRLHLAISPPFAAAWRGEIWLRAAASWPDRRAAIWLGAPSDPRTRTARGASGVTVATWAIAKPGPRWAVLRLLEDDEPQALWDLRAIGAARRGPASGAGLQSPAPVSLRIAIDAGNVSTALVEEEEASAGAPGAKLLGAGPPGSGFLLLAGDAKSAHRVGCAEHLSSSGARLPTVLCAAGPEVLAGLLRGEVSAEQFWLAQAGDEPGPGLRIERFKAPGLRPDWLAPLDDPPDATGASLRLLAVFGQLLGRALAAAHASPLAPAEGGASLARAPLLDRADCVLTYARPIDAEDSERARMDALGAALGEGLRAAWSRASHRLLSRFAAAAPSRDPERFPLEVDAHLGGQSLRISVRLPARAGRPAPAIAGSLAVYQLGGERLLEAASLAFAEPGGASSRARFHERLLALRRSAGGDPRSVLGADEARAIRETLLRWATRLIERQLEGTLRRAAPDGAGFRGAGLHVRLFGEGWKLLALEVPDARRDAELPRVLEHAFAAPERFAPSPRRVEWLGAARLCASAIHLDAELEEPAGCALAGIDSLAGPRWFSLATDAAHAPIPSPQDPWWRDFTGEIAGTLLRVDQWFARGPPFESGLAGGLLAFAPRRSLLKQWLDLCGPSLFALQLRARSRKRGEAG